MVVKDRGCQVYNAKRWPVVVVEVVVVMVVVNVLVMVRKVDMACILA